MWEDILLYVAVGFAAQMVDGAIGMAYGVTSTTVLLSFGITPATASACVHAAETFTTGASGLSHWKLGNVDRKLVQIYALSGFLAGIAGILSLAQYGTTTIAGPGGPAIVSPVQCSRFDVLCAIRRARCSRNLERPA